MNSIRSFFKRKAVRVTSIALVVGGLSISMVDNYFELSKNMEIFSAVYKEVDKLYVDEIEPGQMMKTAIDAMLKSLDPYTNYYSESQIEDFRFMTTGKYGGIGAVVGQQDGKAVVIEVYEGFPAAKAGLQPGDVIKAIDGKDLAGKSSDDVSKLLKGSPKSTLSLSILRPGKESAFPVNITREEIKISSVPYFGMINSTVGYIKFESFTEGSANEVKNAFTALKEKGMKQLVLDLRDNGGGSLNEAVDIVGFFLPKGSLVVDTRGRTPENSEKYFTKHAPIDPTIPITVLVNEFSASASEIVSGSIQDYDRGVIVGQRSFGKGLVQTVRPLVYNTQVKVTISKYYTASGRCVQEVDYSNPLHTKIDSSKRKQFKTMNGRPVFDGGGVTPDVKLPKKEIHEITQYLVGKNYIFDFATQYKLSHPTIADAKSFKLTDKDFEDFVAFLSNKKMDYTTDSEKKLEEYKKIAEQEKYLDRVNAEFSALQAKLKQEKAKDVQHFKAEIMEVLKAEIVSRYYFAKGRIESTFNSDPEIEKAVSLLSEPSQIQKILTPAK